MEPRAVLLVLDGVGAGALPDAAGYGDEGADTLGNLARAAGGLHLPGLARLGLGNLHPIEGVPPAESPEGAWGRLAELSRGKDSTTGHWEMMGLCSCTPFPTYPGGFPPGIIRRFEQETGRSVLGNRAASGTEIIEELGERHLATGALIVYTSADSVFQIAAHEDVIPVELLYEYCSKARAILEPPHGVARVIARPFTGVPGSFARTSRRRDFSLPPPGRTLLDDLAGSGIPVTGVGKVDDLFAHRSITTVHVADNAEGLAVLGRQIASAGSGLIFANLVDFDTRWGHRNDVRGFAEGLAEADRGIAALRPMLRAEDLFIITADHGNDPTTPGTDHTREHAPLLVFGPGVRPVPLGTRRTFADIAATLSEHLGLDGRFGATSFLGEVRD